MQQKSSSGFVKITKGKCIYLNSIVVNLDEGGAHCMTLYIAVTSLFLTLENWLTPHFKGIFMDFPPKSILTLFEKVLIFVQDRTYELGFSIVWIVLCLVIATKSPQISESLWHFK